MATAVVAPFAGWLSLARLQNNSSDGEQLFHGAPIVKRVRHNFICRKSLKWKDLHGVCQPTPVCQTTICAVGVANLRWT